MTLENLGVKSQSKGRLYFRRPIFPKSDAILQKYPSEMKLYEILFFFLNIYNTKSNLNAIFIQTIVLLLLCES